MIFYIVLTHGAKPTGKIGNHPAASQQIANLRGYWDGLKRETKPPPVVHDYRRKITGLSSLPSLSHALATVKASGQGAIVMDNIARLISACDEEQQLGLFNELIDYGDHLVGLRQGGYLSRMNEIQLTMLASGRETTRYTYGGKRRRTSMTKQDRLKQTTEATAASRIARGQAADEKARELDAVREDLSQEHRKPSLKMIAEAANDRGITTTRGGNWSSSTVGRSLKRLDETTLDESTTQDQAQHEH